MIYVVITPAAALNSMFGESVGGPVAEIIARDWGALIVLTGGLLIYGAFRPEYRKLIIVFAVAGKIVFVALVLSFGQSLLAVAWPAITFDSTVVLLLLAYLFASRHQSE